MKKLLGVIGLVTAVLSGALAIGVLRSVSRQVDVAPAAPIQIDVDAAAQRLSRAIRHRTVAPVDSASQAEFERFHAFLTESFPELHERLARETVNQHSLLYTWQGREPKLKPILLMAHMDVVPIDSASENFWTHAPFSGQIAGGYIWGRGAMDDKASVMAVLEAVEHLLSEGFQPARTIYLAFGHDEEIGGSQGAARIAQLLASRKVELEFVLDEGMNILSGIVPGIAAPVALIGIAEKGYLSIQLSTQSDGGHSSIPPNVTAISAVSKALQRLEAKPFPASLHGPSRAMFEFLGPEMAWSKKIALANLWLLEPWVRKQMAKSPLTNALLRTTVAPTVFNAGVKENVLPSQASAVVNLRLIPGNNTTNAIEHVRKAIKNPKIEIKLLGVRMEPSAVSDIESPSFQLIQRTIGETAPQTIVAPSLLVAATDSRHYAGLTKNIFRFLPITLKAEDTKRYHGIDERVSVADYLRCINFYAQLIKNSATQ
ncbi:MAG: M20 family peptidase [Deltaproteobacteria bacterium]|nr:M20 family peptidase [Deltaproteobacteria bacterium]